MSNAKSYLGRKAAKATVRHTVRGTASKARRDPLRATTLVAAGLAAGAVAGWLIARASSGSNAEPSFADAPTPPAAAQPGPQPDPEVAGIATPA